jgi:GAF domain-containing protein
MPLHDPPGQISGVVQVFDKRQGPFSEDDERYLLALFEHAALALANARQYAALTDDYERMSFLYQISKLTMDRDSRDKVRLRDVLLTVMDGATKALKAEASSILLWDRRRRRLVFVAAIGEKERELTEIQVPLDGSIAGWVIQNEQNVIINDVQSDPRFFSGADESTGFVTRNLICSPMEVRGKVVGVLQVLNKLGGASFTEADLQLLQAVADHTASAIKSARRYESLLRVGEHHRRRATAGLFNPLNPLGR